MNANCKYEEKPEKNSQSPFSIESLVHPITLSVGLVSASAYTFCLGYLSFLGIPENPSMWDAIVFFTKGLLFSAMGAVKDVEGNQWLLLFPIFAFFLSFNFVAKFVQEKTSGFISQHVWRTCMYIVGVLLLVYLLSKALNGSTGYMWTIILPPLFTLALILIAPTMQKKLTLQKVLTIPALLFLIMFSWFIPYYRGYNAAFLAEKNPKAFFPRAFDGGDEKVNFGFLLWISSDNSYWLKCTERESLLYGKDKSGHVFYSRYLSGSDRTSLCRRRIAKN